ncbi:MAG: Asp-tRNA(Asn)/Glu-tRNA(Gln) amidotransferase subunit GatC [Cyanobacteria bacterium]|nr:Asp-tRNA(Asn)/Glu-tRNA(Gln) amidotransferase subunit GatC [Cyanobacteriota bacterium]MDA1021065.1 Asp-tRNA(Asn)/Glu-tRNA(Gln) amidotransferase subunit GatC [Cyanobacteriota bacterium]
MSLDREEVIKIAKLANLRLTDEEIDKYSGDLNAILGYVEQLQELDTTGVEPMIGAINHNKELREDKAVDSGLQAKMLENAPDSDGTAIKVPQMS